MALHPLYNGDYIAQAKDEVIRFLDLLEKSLQLKNEGLEFRPQNYISIDIPSFPTYNFNLFKTYTDEKLSSANPRIYIVDLDEVFVRVEECISKYCQLIEQQISTVEQFFLNSSLGNITYEDRETYIFFLQAGFCFKYRAYYKIKRKLISSAEENADLKNPADYILDREAVKEILGIKITNFLRDDYIEMLVRHILFYKYGGPRPSKLPDMHLVDVSQRDVIKICKKIVERFNWESKGRHYISEVFSQLIRDYEDLKPIRYNKETIRKGL